MQIVFVTPEFITEENFDGGLSNYLNRVTISLQQMNHSPIVVVTSDCDEVISHHGIEVHRVRVPRIKPKPSDPSLRRKVIGTSYLFAQSYLLNRRVRLIQRSNQAEIIQYPNLEGIGLFKPANSKSIARISSFTPLFNSAYGQSKGGMQNRIELMSLRRMDGIFGPSKVISNIISNHINRPVEVIESPFILDTSREDPYVYQSRLEGKSYLLFFGTIGVLKGVDVIADIIHDVLKKDKNLYFVFAGKEYGAPFHGLKMMEYIFSQAKECKDQVIYLGKLHHDQLYPVIRNAQAVILPSRIDNFPNTCLEAMAFNRIVVGTYGTSFEQLIDDGISGFLCQPGSREGLNMCIDKVLCLTDTEKSTIGLQAAKRIERLHPDVVVHQLIQYYEKVIQGNDHTK
jgi:glycosyltransferase involved in cell wall biosynthesis